MAIWWLWLNSWRVELSGNVCVEVLPGWMVDMVELVESGCYGPKAVLSSCGTEWSIWLCSRRVVLLAKVSVELFCGWMVDMVELGGSMCYGAKSVLRCFVA